MHGTALHDAAQNGAIEVVELLLKNGADVNSKNTFGSTAFFVAVCYGYVDIAKLLFSQVTKIPALEEDEAYNVLYQAGEMGCYRLANLFIDSNTPLNVEQQNHRNTLVYLAAACGYTPILKSLFSKGPDLPLVNFRGDTVPSLAAFYGHGSVLQFLFTLPNAKFHVQDRHGRSLIWWAAAGGRTTVLKMLIKDKQLDPRTPDTYGRTPACIAARKGFDEVIDFLNGVYAEKGWDASDLSEATYSRKPVWYPDSVLCDVCTLRIDKRVPAYRCFVCAGRPWIMCEECKSKGAHCVDAEHIMVRFVFKGIH